MSEEDEPNSALGEASPLIDLSDATMPLDMSNFARNSDTSAISRDFLRFNTTLGRHQWHIRTTFRTSAVARDRDRRRRQGSSIRRILQHAPHATMSSGSAVSLSPSLSSLSSLFRFRSRRVGVGRPAHTPHARYFPVHYSTTLYSTSTHYITTLFSDNTAISPSSSSTRWLFSRSSPRPSCLASSSRSSRLASCAIDPVRLPVPRRRLRHFPPPDPNHGL
jgi:hypothetical protein